MAGVAGQIAGIARDRRHRRDRKGRKCMEVMEIADEHHKAEARYAYYRRCQVFMKSGRQCKAPAEKGAQICRNHAGQIETKMRRERERWAVLEITAEQMRTAGRVNFTAKQIFRDPRAIQMALNVTMQALASESIDDKTAVRLMNELQSAVSNLQRSLPAESLAVAVRRKGQRSKSLGLPTSG